MLSYRTLMSIRPPQDTDPLQGVVDRTFAWMKEKGLDVDGAQPNGEYEVAEHARLKWIVSDTEHTTDTHRFILTEESPSGNWVSTITVRQPRDLHNPGRRGQDLHRSPVDQSRTPAARP